MTAIFSVICGKYDESQDLENDFKDKHGPLNKHVFFSENISSFLFWVFELCSLFYSKDKQPANYISKFGDENLRSKLNEDDLNELRKKREFEVKMSQIMKEISIYSLFLGILFVVAFSNLSSSSYQYNQLFLNTFVHKQKGENMGLNEVNFKNWFFPNIKL
jgi:hypothetical protein